MPSPQRGRRGSYNSIQTDIGSDENDAHDHEVDVAAAADNVMTSNNNTVRSNVRSIAARLTTNRSHRQRYSSLETEGEEQESNMTAIMTAAAPKAKRSVSAAPSADVTQNDSSSNSASGNNEDADDTEKDDGRRMTVVVLDFAQNRFRVTVCPLWSVRKFKQVGASVHKVQPALQRLIFRGKLLQDEQILEESGIAEDEMIVHLFPKPRVIIHDKNTDNSGASSHCTDATSSENGDDNNNDNNSAGGGAHVPTIVLNSNEAEQRGQILVLGSPDFLEAQNNVRMFSFMLIIISSIELMNLLSVAVGTDVENNSNIFSGCEDDFLPPSDDCDTGPHHQTNSSTPENILYKEWTPANYVDLAISSLGVYVAVTGLKASSENTIQLARVYLWGTFATGVVWILFNFYITVKQEEQLAEQQESKNEHSGNDDFQIMTQSDIYQAALSIMVLPGMVWLLCCARAWQFHHLLREAEEEAENRVQQELADLEIGRNGTISSSSQSTTESNNNDDDVNHDEELVLQDERYTIS